MTPADPGLADDEGEVQPGFEWAARESEDQDLEPGRGSAWDKKDVQQHREITRRALATGSLALVGVLAVGLLVGLLAGLVSSADERDFTAGVFVPILTATGTMFGFYFGAQSKGDS